MPHALLLITDGFDDTQTDGIVGALKQQGFDVTIGGIAAGTTVTGSGGGQRTIDKDYLNLNLTRYDLLVVPGGTHGDALAGHKSMVNIVYSMAYKGRVVATVGTATRLLVEAAAQKTSPNPVPTGTHILTGGILEHRAVTGEAALREPLEQAGAKFVDESIVTDGPIITAASHVDPRRLVAAIVPTTHRYRAVVH